LLCRALFLSILFIWQIDVYNAVATITRLVSYSGLHLILKSNMTFPNDETGQVLAEMQEAGIDLTIVHNVVFFQLFEKKEQAEAMASYLAENAPDIKVNIHPDETPNVWDLECSIKLVPMYDAVIAQEAQFEQIATKFNGYNDGWGIEA